MFGFLNLRNLNSTWDQLSIIILWVKKQLIFKENFIKNKIILRIADPSEELLCNSFIIWVNLFYSFFTCILLKDQFFFYKLSKQKLKSW